MFQFLIGRLATYYPNKSFQRQFLFQFLIGRLATGYTKNEEDMTYMGFNSS